MTPAVSVVVPLYNEAGTLAELVERLARTLDAEGLTFEVLLVDDGSRDETPAVARDVAARDARVRVLTLSRNFGQSAALCCGLFEARGDVVITMDGDLQNPPEAVPELLRAMRPDVDLVTALREVRHERAWRLVGSRLVHWVSRLLIGADLQDYGGQFKAYRRHVIEATRTAWAPGKPFFALAVWLGFRVAQVPVRHDPRRIGESRYRLASLVRLNVDVITSFTTIPLAVLAVLSLVCTTAGSIGLAWAVASHATGLGAQLSLLLVGLGGVFFAAAALGVYLARVYRTVAGAPMGYVLRRPDDTAGGSEPRGG